MNKILNWTFGACFRTLGRFLAIFIVGVLLIFIGSKIGIELPDWLSLNIKAAEREDWIGSIEYPFGSYKMYDLTSSSYSEISLNYTSVERYSPTDLLPVYENSSSAVIGANGIMHAFNIQNQTKAGYLYQLSYYTCSNNKLSAGVVNVDLFIDSTRDWVLERNSNTTLYQSVNITGISAYNANYCYMYTILFVPALTTSHGITSNNSWAGIRLRRAGSTNISNNYIASLGFSISELGIYTETINDSIKNSGFATADSVEQVQESVSQVQQELEQTNDTITNEDTQGAEDAASGFFNDFNTETFGLTSIITAPLNAINSIINSSCNNLVLPLPFVEKNLTLPCMNSIYSNYFRGFFDLYQIITTGLISYYIIVRIFNLVKDFKNPEHDEIEVMDL